MTCDRLWQCTNERLVRKWHKRQKLKLINDSFLGKIEGEKRTKVHRVLEKVCQVDRSRQKENVINIIFSLLNCHFLFSSVHELIIITFITRDNDEKRVKKYYMILFCFLLAMKDNVKTISLLKAYQGDEKKFFSFSRLFVRPLKRSWRGPSSIYLFENERQKNLHHFFPCC